MAIIWISTCDSVCKRYLLTYSCLLLSYMQHCFAVTKAVEDSPSVLSSQTYAARRYAVGLGEGTKELPPGNCFPLESNGNFLNGGKLTKIDGLVQDC